jgi:hypothetical protein
LHFLEKAKAGEGRALVVKGMRKGIECHRAIPKRPRWGFALDRKKIEGSKVAVHPRETVLRLHSRPDQNQRNIRRGRKGKERKRKARKGKEEEKGKGDDTTSILS